MNLHEYQAKQLFFKNNLPIPIGYVCSTKQEATDATAKIPGNKWAVKCQVHTGGRGKAGGIEVVNNKEAVEAFANKWLGKNLVTYQTDATGQPVNQILVEAATDIDKELYLSIIVDRSLCCIVCIASTEGGVEIEKIAKKTPELIYRLALNPLIKLQPLQGRELAFKLGLNGEQIVQFTKIFMEIYKLFLTYDLTLIEINPLVITKQGDLICLDCKLSVDDNALFRQVELHNMRDPSQEDKREAHAATWKLNYVALNGNIGCMVNGAGLAMATMDIIKLHGGRPANFLDVGGGATKERVTEAFKIILSDENIKVVLVNIFGGIVRCDLIADGIIRAISQVDIKVPVVVRLEGNNAELGAKKLADNDLNIIVATSLTDAIYQVIDIIGIK
ncbi:ADP-forming succinate--CoA ligase subunit beta [Candidatus Fukatsuia anoeciicola]|uniref:ADP-forming succinate--CoA ligase subunit beta n=1 Tax=Candidatus Fukatsuia anoeciicola TaxID=2994492 RepID=UPI0034642BD4